MKKWDKENLKEVRGLELVGEVKLQSADDGYTYLLPARTFFRKQRFDEPWLCEFSGPQYNGRRFHVPRSLCRAVRIVYNKRTGVVIARKIRLCKSK
jgi:hypothetical protein